MFFGGENGMLIKKSLTDDDNVGMKRDQDMTYAYYIAI